MIGKIKSFGINGVDGYLVDVEADLSTGQTKQFLVGLPDASVKESSQRVQSAIRNSNFDYPVGTLVINLAPADTRKEGPLYDLPSALGILVATGVIIQPEMLDDFAFVGELGLDGTLRRVNGVLPILITAAQTGIKKVLIPQENSLEAAYIDGVEVYTAKNLTSIVSWFNGTNPNGIKQVTKKKFQDAQKDNPYTHDLRFVKGQFVAKRALEIAAAGGHNILLIGPPGSGKTMLAKCFPSIMPDMTFAESLATTKIHSIAGTLDHKKGIIATRPFRTPHHTASVAALAGGGKNSKPGEISLAHNGVLFLDEMPEYTRSALEILRQPLEDNKIIIARAAATVEYPASFTLIASMNPCPCGNHGSRTTRCNCKPSAVQKYLSKLSGPLLDRIDLHIEVDSVTYDDLSSKTTSEDSSDVKSRIDVAKGVQLERFTDSTEVFCNAKMSDQMTKKYCNLDLDCEKILRNAFDKLGLSARAYTRILRVARTIADLEGFEEINPDHIMEAISYRTLDRRQQ